MGRLKTQIFGKKASAIMHASILYMHDNIKKKKKNIFTCLMIDVSKAYQRFMHFIKGCRFNAQQSPI